MTDRPYVVVSCAVSLDGCLDGGSGPLALSNAEDLRQVHALRAGCDAIMVGAATVRQDDPRLLATGYPSSPTKVTITSSGDLDPQARFFTTGDVVKLVYCASPAYREVDDQLGDRATVVDAGRTVELSAVLAELAGRGVRRLLVEGGSVLLTQFLTDDVADELRLVIAPFFVGRPEATRFVGPGAFPWHVGRRADLVAVNKIGDVAQLRYSLSERFLP